MKRNAGTLTFWSEGWVSVSYGMFTLEIEYIGALNEFKANEFSFGEGKNPSPRPGTLS